MADIQVIKKPPREKLDDLGVFNWDIWEKRVCEFTWTYYIEETCYLLEGEATVTPDGGEPVHFGAGDLVIFPPDLSCTWKITKPIRKHYALS